MSRDTVSAGPSGTWQMGAAVPPVPPVPLHRRPAARRVIFGVVGAWCLFGLIWGTVDAAMQWSWYGAVLNLALGVGGAVCCLYGARRLTVNQSFLLLALAIVLGCTMQAVNVYTGSFVFYLVAWAAPFRTSLWQAAVIGLADALGFLGISLGVGMPSDAAAGMSMGMVFTLLFGMVVRQYLVVSDQTEATAQARASEAVLAERSRLAREIHDVLAHSLSAQIVHLEGARLLLERGSDPKEALNRVTRAGHFAREGMEETRRALDTLRGDDLSVPEQLERLAMEFRGATGASCEVSASDESAQLAPEARLAVVRTAQEALTNVRKHAVGAGVTVALRRSGQWCELDVRDTGGSSTEFADAGGGYGLVGLRERAELLGGSLDAGRDGTGFQVLLRVPA